MGRKITDIAGLVVVCSGKKCKKNGAKAIAKGAKQALEARGLHKRVPILKTKCTGHCKQAPVASVQPGNVWIAGRSEAATIEAIEEALPALDSA